MMADTPYVPPRRAVFGRSEVRETSPPLTRARAARLLCYTPISSLTTNNNIEKISENSQPVALSPVLGLSEEFGSQSNIHSERLALMFTKDENTVQPYSMVKEPNICSLTGPNTIPLPFRRSTHNIPPTQSDIKSSFSAIISIGGSFSAITVNDMDLKFAANSEVTTSSTGTLSIDKLSGNIRVSFDSGVIQEPLFCICGKRCVSAAALSDHWWYCSIYSDVGKLSKKSKRRRPSGAANGPFECPCGAQFANEALLTNHQKKVRKHVRCTCGRRFQNSTALSSHLKYSKRHLNKVVAMIPLADTVMNTQTRTGQAPMLPRDIKSEDSQLDAIPLFQTKRRVLETTSPSRLIVKRGKTQFGAGEHVGACAPEVGGKGKVMLEKMGWMPGTSLGRNKNGLLQPYMPIIREIRSGLA